MIVQKRIDKKGRVFRYSDLLISDIVFDINKDLKNRYGEMTYRILFKYNKELKRCTYYCQVKSIFFWRNIKAKEILILKNIKGPITSDNPYVLSKKIIPIFQAIKVQKKIKITGER